MFYIFSDYSLCMLTACIDRQRSSGLTAAIYTGHNSSHIKPLAGKLHAFQWYTELNDNSGEICISIPLAFKELSIILFVIAAEGNANTMTVQTTNKSRAFKFSCTV